MRVRTEITAPLLLAGAVVLTVSSCSLGASEFNGNRPDPTPSRAQIVRTPAPVSTDLPFTDPPLGQTLPGPTGGAPGDVPTTAPPASPGEDEPGLQGGGPTN